MAKKHIHKYAHVDLPYLGKVWACRLRDCNHYMPKHLESLVIGKGSFCWECDKEITLDPTNMEDDMPVCRSCKHGNVSEKDVDKFLINRDGLFK